MPTKIPSGNFGVVTIRVHWTTVMLVMGAALLLVLIPLFQENANEPTGAKLLAVFGMGIALYGSLLLHEFGHALVARGLGMGPLNATLFPFGEISNVHEQAASAINEGVIAAAGPMVNVVLGTVFGVVGTLLPGLSPMAKAELELLGVANLLLALINLFPGLPLDGGRMLRALVWFLNGKRDQGTRFALGIGLIAPWLFMAGGFALGLANLPIGLWLFFTGLLVGLACGDRYQKAVGEEENEATR